MKNPCYYLNVMTRNIEVEVRALVTPDEFARLKKFFNKNARFLNRHSDETVYFDENGQVRLRREKIRAYFVRKAGKIHDKHREELEIGIDKADFDSAKKFMEFLGRPAEVEWHRERFVWSFLGLKAYLDNTRGYGSIFELEAVVAPREKERAYQKMLKIFNDLKIKPTPKEKIQKHYRYYLKNWRKLIK